MKTDRRIRHSPGRGRLRTNPRRGQAGYALLMAMFMVVLMIISADVVLQNLATEGRRQREAETIWRGRQYMRAIRLYYQKTGHYPQTLEDLQKGLPELHFLRLVAYRDPMNRPDGEWRMIYVNPAGQIIGSVRYATLQQMALMDLNGGQIPAGAVLPNFSVSAGALGAPATGGQSLGATQTGVGTSLQGSQSATSDSSSGAAQSSSSSQSAALGQAAAALAQLKPTGPVDGPVIGGLLTGVGSKVDAASVKVYRGGKHPHEAQKPVALEVA